MRSAVVFSISACDFNTSLAIVNPFFLSPVAKLAFTDCNATGDVAIIDSTESYSHVEFDASRSVAQWFIDKVITTMVIRPLNDRTHCARSAITQLGLWRKLYECLLDHFTTSQCILKCALLTFSSTSNRLDKIWKGDFTSRGLERYDVWSWDRRSAHQIAPPWIPISSPLAHIMVYLLPTYLWHLNVT